jgi:pimeloyl-ACP methyl ester carboxylesterase
VLVLAGERDVLCPPGPAAELARRAPAGELRTLPGGHFDLYDGGAFAEEAEFLGAALV